MARVKYPDERPAAQFGKTTKRVKKPAYLDWVRQLPCVVTGRQPVEAAHLSTTNPRYGHTGRGKGSKASDRWTLPLCPELHRDQHSMNEMQFWKAVGVNPHVTCLTLWGIYSDLGNAGLARATELINSQTFKKSESGQ